MEITFDTAKTEDGKQVAFVARIKEKGLTAYGKTIQMAADKLVKMEADYDYGKANQ